MAITVEYGKCGECGDNNVKTAQACRACAALLPWSRAGKTTAAVPAGVAVAPRSGPKIDLSMGYSAGFYIQILGGLLFVGGGLIFGAHVLGLFHTPVPVGRITMVIGSLIWGSGAAMDKHGADN